MENLKVDRSKLPQGTYVDINYESRQVVDFDILKIVTQY